MGTSTQAFFRGTVQPATTFEKGGRGRARGARVLRGHAAQPAQHQVRASDAFGLWRRPAVSVPVAVRLDHLRPKAAGDDAGDAAYDLSGGSGDDSYRIFRDSRITALTMQGDPGSGGRRPARPRRGRGHPREGQTGVAPPPPPPPAAGRGVPRRCVGHALHASGAAAERRPGGRDRLRSSSTGSEGVRLGRAPSACLGPRRARRCVRLRHFRLHLRSRAGVRLTAMKAKEAVVCPRCGALNRRIWPFCARCNESLEGAAEAPERGDAQAASARAGRHADEATLGGAMTRAGPAGAGRRRAPGRGTPRLTRPLRARTRRSSRSGLCRATAVAAAARTTPGLGEYRGRARALAERRPAGRSREPRRRGGGGPGQRRVPQRLRLRALAQRRPRARPRRAGRGGAAGSPAAAGLRADARRRRPLRRRPAASTRRCSRRCPDAATVHQDLGRMLFRTGDFAKAAAHLQQAAASQPWDPVLQQELAYALDQTGDNERATAVYREILQQRALGVGDTAVSLGEPVPAGAEGRGDRGAAGGPRRPARRRRCSSASWGGCSRSRVATARPWRRTRAICSRLRTRPTPARWPRGSRRSKRRAKAE